MSLFQIPDTRLFWEYSGWGSGMLLFWEIVMGMLLLRYVMSKNYDCFIETIVRCWRTCGIIDIGHCGCHRLTNMATLYLHQHIIIIIGPISGGWGGQLDKSSSCYHHHNMYLLCISTNFILNHTIQRSMVLQKNLWFKSNQFKNAAISSHISGLCQSRKAFWNTLCVEHINSKDDFLNNAVGLMYWSIFWHIIWLILVRTWYRTWGVIDVNIIAVSKHLGST